MTNHRRVPLLLVFAGFAACGGEPLGVGARGGTDVTMQAAVVNDDAGIEAFIEAEGAAWAAKDADAFAAGYSEDAQFYNPLGALLDGREAIRAQHAFLFAGVFAATMEATSILDIRYLTGTIAIVHTTTTTTGFGALPPGLHPTEPGVLRTVATYVLVKRADQWQAVAKQITAIP